MPSELTPAASPKDAKRGDAKRGESLHFRRPGTEVRKLGPSPRTPAMPVAQDRAEGASRPGRRFRLMTPSSGLKERAGQFSTKTRMAASAANNSGDVGRRSVSAPCVRRVRAPLAEHRGIGSRSPAPTRSCTADRLSTGGRGKPVGSASVLCQMPVGAPGRPPEATRVRPPPG